MQSRTYEYILVRYGELSTKGKNRKDFIARLLQNTRNILQRFERLEYEKTHDRLYIKLNGEDADSVTEELKKVFGISSYSLAIKIPSTMEDIVACSYEVAIEDPSIKTFKMMARRHDKLFPSSSDEINRTCATKILKESELKVDVHNPDLKIYVEVHRDCTYVMAKVIPASGGYPVGIGGKAMLLVSGGIDSPVAGWMTLKRGVSLECVHFASPPYTSQAALDKVQTLVSKLSGYQGKIKLHVVPFTELQMAIYEHCDESYAITIMRRMMIRIAHQLAEKNKCLALVSGESVGQVASQTLESIQTINEVTNFPILRPVIGMDKLEIIDRAKKMNSYEISILPFEDCCTIFTPKNPVTKPTVKKALQQENRFDFQPLVDKCIEEVETILVRPMEEENKSIF